MQHFEKIQNAAELRGSAGKTIWSIIVVARARKGKIENNEKKIPCSSVNILVCEPREFNFFQFAGKWNKCKGGPYGYPDIFSEVLSA